MSLQGERLRDASMSMIKVQVLSSMMSDRNNPTPPGRLHPLSNNKLQTSSLNNNLHLLHRIYNEVGSTALNLGPFMARADGNDDRPGGDACTDPGRRILENYAIPRVVSELFRGEQEGVGRRLASLKTLVVGGDGHLGRGDADARHTAVGLATNKSESDIVREDSR